PHGPAAPDGASTPRLPQHAIAGKPAPSWPDRRTAAALRASSLSHSDTTSRVWRPHRHGGSNGAEAGDGAAGRSARRRPHGRPPRNRLHLAAVAASGAVGGAFGLATLPLELPLSTTLILRSVADIARGEGEDLEDPEGLLSCLEVFALGSGRDVALGESSYFA